MIVDLAALQSYARSVVKAGGVRAVYLIGSAQSSTDPNDIDLLYVLDYTTEPDADHDDPRLIDFIETHTTIDPGAGDTFYKAGDSYWHLSFGAGASLVRNDEYAREQAGRLMTRLA